MKIAGRSIGGTEPPFIVAEISCNHNGSLAVAKRLIKAAKEAGADAVKTQCYEADTITLDCKKPDFIIQSGLWRGQSLHELYSKTATPFGWHPDLYKVAQDAGITIFSSVFDRSSIDFLEGLGCPAYKIASFEIVDTPLIEYAARTGKPLIISTGLATDADILDANEASGGKAAFLHCTSEYPSVAESADISRMFHIDSLLKFQNPVGISDHTVTDVVPIAATATRAAIIEKHLMLQGILSEDATFSLDENDFAGMVDKVRQTHAAMQHRPAQLYPSKQFRRSLYVTKAIAQGEVFTSDNIRSIRPGYGAAPKRINSFLGKPAKRNYRKGDPLQ